MARVFGYLRVSTKGQTTENQKLEILNKGFKVDEWFSEDAVSGTVEAFQRLQFSKMVGMAQPGDIVVTVKIDRLGRTSADTLQAIKQLTALGLSIVVIQLGTMDITSPAGKLMLSMLAAVAEMERDTLIERIEAGLARTKEEGTILGPPLKIVPTTMRAICAERAQGITLDKIATKYNLQKSTVDRNVKVWASKIDKYEGEFNTRAVQYKAAEAKRIEKAKRASF